MKQDRYYIQIEVYSPHGLLHAQLFSGSKINIPNDLYIPSQIENLPIETRVLLFNPGGYLIKYEQSLVPAQKSAIIMALGKTMRSIQKKLNELN